MLGFVQKHRAQSQSPKFFLIHITHFRVIGVPGGCLASSSLFLDEMFSSSYIHFDVPIKGGFSQECQPFLFATNINVRMSHNNCDKGQQTAQNSCTESAKLGLFRQFDEARLLDKK